LTQVDFYVLAETTARSRQLFCCRLAEKAFGLGHRVFVHAGSEGAAREVDELMWTFRDRSFLPHCLAADDPATPIHVGSGAEPAPGFHLLINLADDVPDFVSRFERVAEVVDGGGEQKRLGRERFRFYKDRGYPLETHKL
jgi:DNA polymerase III subunit chi